jgi:L-rhamnose mutarotase
MTIRAHQIFKGETMQRIGMTWQVKPEHWEAYKQIHLNPWPELITAMQEHGIHNYSIFAFGTRMFAYMEVDGDDAAGALQALEQTDIKKKWNAEVTIWVEPEAAEGTGVQFLELERVFYCP